MKLLRWWKQRKRTKEYERNRRVACLAADEIRYQLMATVGIERARQILDEAEASDLKYVRLATLFGEAIAESDVRIKDYQKKAAP